MSQKDLLSQVSNKVNTTFNKKAMSSFAMAGSKVLDEEDGTAQSSERCKSGVSSRAESQMSLDEDNLVAKLPVKLKEFVLNNKNKDVSALFESMAPQIEQQMPLDVEQNLQVCSGNFMFNTIQNYGD